jgi:hypothetical protein
MYQPNEGASEGKEHCSHSEEILSLFLKPLTFREEIRVHNILMGQSQCVRLAKKGEYVPIA